MDSTPKVKQLYEAHFTLGLSVNFLTYQFY